MCRYVQKSEMELLIVDYRTMGEWERVRVEGCVDVRREVSKVYTE